ncbi:MAG: NTP transferase domain-containing protein [Thermoflexales bacterium]|nr:NTP transferase domain-containing protein [Thermoflexales bacterium]
MPAMSDVVGVILGGGRGNRLFPLTRDRAKPAVPIAGKYRLIDVPISNCINSGIYRVAVLTQFNSVSLHRHIARTYIFDTFHRGYVQVLAAEQTASSEAWYQGTADAVRKQLLEIQSSNCEYVLILAGDHLYHMDYAALAQYHWEHQADITVAVQPVRKEEASRFGLLKRTPDGRIVDFVEKPKDPAVLNGLVSRDDPARPFLGSMGIYMFKTKVLVNLLTTTTDDDFGGEVIPSAIKSHDVFGFDFDGYWEDIGTIRSFYETNLALSRSDSPFNLHDPARPIYTRPRHLPSSIIDGATLNNVLLSDGCHIGHATIRDSLIGLRGFIADDVQMSDTIMMGSDFYDPTGFAPPGGVPLGIGKGCSIEGAILDKNARLGPGVIIKPFPRGTDITNDLYFVRDGIVVIAKNTIIPAETVIAPRD